MSKRFTDTEKWNKKFVRSLRPEYKLLWMFILDECNTAGIWDVDIEVAEIKTGVKLKEKEAVEIFSGKVLPIDNGTKWFVPAFIEFQYGELNESNRAHTKAILLLKKYNLLDEHLKIKPLTRTLQGPTEGPMVVEEDKVMVKEQVIVSEEFSKFLIWVEKNAPRVMKMQSPITEPAFNALIADYPNDVVAEILFAMHNYKDLLKKNLDANLTFRNWASRRNIQPVQAQQKKQVVI